MRKIKFKTSPISKTISTEDFEDPTKLEI